MKNLLLTIISVLSIATVSNAQEIESNDLSQKLTNIDLLKYTPSRDSFNANIDGYVYYKDEAGNLIPLFDTQIDLYYKDGDNNDAYMSEKTIDLKKDDTSNYWEGFEPKAAIFCNAYSRKMPKDKRVRIVISHPGFETYDKTRKPTAEPVPDGRIKLAIHLGNVILKKKK